MSKSLILRAVLALALMVVLAPRSPAPVIYRPGQGWEVEGAESVEETSKEQLDKAEKYEKAEKWEEARDAYRGLVKTWPLSPNAPEAQYRYAMCQSKLYQFAGAFKEFQRCLDKYPDTTHFDDILKNQYEIACLFLAGERQKLWVIPTLPSMDKAVEMFEQVIKNGPYSKYAAMCQLKIGFAREKQHKWADAVKAYQELIRKYPRSDLADDAQFQIGYANMSASQAIGEAEYDQSATDHAIQGFEDYITKYPGSEKIEQAKENIAKLQKGQASGLMKVAEYYDRAGKYDAALIYYNKVVQKFPSSELAKRASERAEQIKKRQYERLTDDIKKEDAATEKPAPAPDAGTENPAPAPKK